MEVKFGLLASTSMLCNCFNDFKFCRLMSFAGMTMEVKRSLQRNILRFTCVQSLPNVTCPIAVHRKNTPSPKRTLLPGNTIFSNPLQPSKAKSPMDESPEGSTMPFREAALLNAFLPMPTTRYIVLLCFTLAGTDSHRYTERVGGQRCSLGR